MNVFRQLTPTDEAAGYQTIVETVDWLRAKGIKLWEKQLPRPVYADRQACGENFGLFVDGELAVIVSLVNGVPRYWAKACCSGASVKRRSLTVEQPAAHRAAAIPAKNAIILRSRREARRFVGGVTRVFVPG
jgi:hypothetical protein